jgi:hypothetical protein
MKYAMIRGETPKALMEKGKEKRYSREFLGTCLQMMDLSAPGMGIIERRKL